MRRFWQVLKKGSFVLNKVLWLGNIQRKTSVKDADRCRLAENGLSCKVRLNQKCTTGGRNWVSRPSSINKLVMGAWLRPSVCCSW